MISCDDYSHLTHTNPSLTPLQKISLSCDESPARMGEEWKEQNGKEDGTWAGRGNFPCVAGMYMYVSVLFF